MAVLGCPCLYLIVPLCHSYQRAYGDLVPFLSYAVPFRFGGLDRQKIGKVEKEAGNDVQTPPLL